ncbi:MAG: phosphoenolpyruvate synthase regulatory protein [Desulfobulbaceae bacterium A2]|nr:MAG: phosphoenolpyruvate synthase regulatory protein [Desulfobulbaceae bacterium A2]
MWSVKDVYYVSDSTAILAEGMGRALLCQFPEINFNEERIPFVRDATDARKALTRILKQSGGRYPLVFCTIIETDPRLILDSPEIEFFDLLGPILERLEHSLEAKALREPGFSHHADRLTLARRVDAIHYSIEHDDGTRTREYDKAEIILVGVSRSGKTPVCVYLATQMGYKAANFPLTAEYLDQYQLPQELLQQKHLLVGLTTSPQVLHEFREKRYGGSRYARLDTCTQELEQAQRIFERYKIPVIATNGRSIEEIAVAAIEAHKGTRPRGHHRG